jgi:hypothetical protein
MLFEGELVFLGLLIAVLVLAWPSRKDDYKSTEQKSEGGMTKKQSHD